MHRRERRLPAGAPAACEKFRQQPDALERAAELDAQYGSNPDLEKLPMYCTVITVKNWYDVNDMRSTGGNDVNYAMDVAPRDMTIVSQLRAKGAIISGITIASEPSFNNDGDQPSRRPRSSAATRPQHLGRHACNPYDTERTPGRQQRRRRRIRGGEPRDLFDLRNHRRLLPHTRERQRGRELRHDQGHDFRIRQRDRRLHQSSSRRVVPHARRRGACHRCDEGSEGRLLRQPRLLHRAAARASPKEPFASSIVANVQPNDKPLKGLRVGIVREFMVKHSPNDAAISDLVDKEFKTILRDRLGAELVESVDPQYPDDPSVPNMKYTFADAFAEVLPISAPEYFFQKTERRRARVRGAGLRRDVARLPGQTVAAPGAAVAEAEHAAHLAAASTTAAAMRS